MKKGFIYILIAAFLFASFEPVSKLVSIGVRPLEMTLIRFFIGTLILIPYSINRVKMKGIVLTRTNYLHMALLGVLLICVSMPLLQFAVLVGDSPAIIAVIFSANSVFTVLLAAIFLNEPITIRKIFAIILCFAGIMVCMDFKTGTNFQSVALVVAAAFTFSLYTVMGKKFMATLSGPIQTGYSFLFGSIVLLFVVIMTGGFSLHVDMKGLGIILYLGVFVSGVGYWVYFAAMEQTSAMEASLVFFIKPVLTPFLTFFLLGTPITLRVCVSLVLVVVGSVLATRKKDTEG